MNCIELLPLLFLLLALISAATPTTGAAGPTLLVAHGRSSISGKEGRKKELTGAVTTSESEFLHRHSQKQNVLRFEPDSLSERA